MSSGNLSSAVESERKFQVVSAEWKKAVIEAFDIEQHYVPDLDANSVRLAITTADGETKVTAYGPGGEKLCVMPIPKEAMEKFGHDNLARITNENGTVPVGGPLEARLRLKNGKHQLTIKAETGVLGKRYELEFSVSESNAEKLLPYCPEAVSKTRNIVEHGGKKWEVDVYKDKLAGLVMAEVELPDLGENISLPAWAGKERTGDPRFSNRALAKCPSLQSLRLD